MPATVYMTTPTSSTGFYDVWDTWVTTRTIQTSTSSTAWVVWVDDLNITGTSTGRTTSCRPPPMQDLPRRTPEQEEAHRRSLAESRLRVEKELRERRRAQRKARILLLRNLKREQVEQYKRHGFFDVTGAVTGQKYRIRKGRVANVSVLSDGGSPLYRLCCHPNVGCPDEDTMLAQALYLESDFEVEFVSTANIHQGPGVYNS